MTDGDLQDPFGTGRVSKRVCIIGAGANGLATLKVLSETHQVQSGQWSLVAFEERDNVGGVWYCPQDHLFHSHLTFFSFVELGIPHLPLGILP
jgi:cation diffusion facilitator CzcD-associated flavoprotein CzcO